MGHGGFDAGLSFSSSFGRLKVWVVGEVAGATERF